jgi:hypothetical protein
MKQYIIQWRKNNPDRVKMHGKKYYQNHKECYKKYNKNKYIKLREIMQELKFNGCAICGYNKCNGALEFHHVNPEDKKFWITERNLCFKDSKILIELNKCILLCCNCHREITFKEKK